MRPVSIFAFALLVSAGLTAPAFAEEGAGGCPRAAQAAAYSAYLKSESEVAEVAEAPAAQTFAPATLAPATLAPATLAPTTLAPATLAPTTKTETTMTTQTGG
jgi:hypothetical protein